MVPDGFGHFAHGFSVEHIFRPPVEMVVNPPKVPVIAEGVGVRFLVRHRVVSGRRLEYEPEGAEG